MEKLNFNLVFSINSLMKDVIVDGSERKVVWQLGWLRNLWNLILMEGKVGDGSFKDPTKDVRLERLPVICHTYKKALGKFCIP
jgi:hypothetical protein